MEMIVLNDSDSIRVYAKKYGSDINFTGTIKVLSEIEHDPSGKFIIYHIVDGLFHREDGPAIEWESGKKYWYYEDVQHRTDGPAVIHQNGEKTWMLNGQRMSAEEHFMNLTSEQQEKAIWRINEWR